MDRSQTLRRLLIFFLAAVWFFLMLAVGSFHMDDWPSHQVYPYPSVSQNLCGKAGAYIAYCLFFALGQGVFPILFFAGICLAIYVFQNRITDLWFRLIGLLLLSVAFSAAVHLIKPGSPTSFPEGHGGLIGIGASNFLRHHFNTVGTSLILMLSFFVGLLLAADDLVIRGSGWVGTTIQNIRTRAPQVAFKFPQLPRLPALPFFVTKDAVDAPHESKRVDAKVIGSKPVGRAAADEDDDEPLKPQVLLRQNGADVTERPKAYPASALEDGPIELSYDNDEIPAAAQEQAYQDESDPAPAEAAIIPPRAESNVSEPVMEDEEGALPVDVATMVEARRDIIVRLPNTIRPRQSSPPPALPKELGEYHLPQWDCLADAEHGFAEAQETFVREKAAILEQALNEFNIDAHVVEIDTGPVITMYELALAPGIKVAAITQLHNDIARALKATSVRIVAPVPGKNTVGIEVPNAQKEKVRLKELMALAPEAMSKMAIPLFLGKDASGEPLITDLAAMPHCLIAGTTGSGKSVCINTIIMSIMYLQRPDMVKLILVDPKVVEMAPFKDIPHLMAPVITDTGRATSVLEWACEKMDERYELLAEAGVRNIKDYNKLTREELNEKFQPSSPEEEARIPKQMPYWVIIIDELADLMMTSGKEVEGSIVRLAQKARAVGIHVIVATQRPQATVVTGLIKSNMPSKIAFRVNTKMDSRIVIDQNGGELLLGHGDMLFLPPGASRPIRAQGTYIDDKEIRESVKLVKTLAESQYEPELVQIRGTIGVSEEMEKDDLFDQAVRVVLETKRGSVSLLQRRLTIGYGRASRLIEMMAQAGIVGEYKGTQSREATITVAEWDAMQSAAKSDAASGMSV